MRAALASIRVHSRQLPALRRRRPLLESCAAAHTVQGHRRTPERAPCPQRRAVSATSGMPDPLHWETANFNSAMVNVATVSVEDTADFALKLFSTVTELKAQRKAALWLKVPMDYSHYIPIAGHYGFKYHHVLPDAAMLVLWLPDDVPNKVPKFATHNIGVAGCVVNSDRELLLVKEMRENAMWKLPGGLADLGEDLGVTAVREVREETGVECAFKSVLTVRHQHGMQFGNSDLYFVCRLEPLSEDIKICSHEIEEACWMPLDRFRGETQHSMLHTVAQMLDRPEQYELVETEQPSVVAGRSPYKLYHRPL